MHKVEYTTCERIYLERHIRHSCNNFFFSCHKASLPFFSAATRTFCAKMAVYGGEGGGVLRT